MAENTPLVLDEMTADLTVYLNPDLLHEEHVREIKKVKIAKNELEKYQILLVEIKWAYIKLIKYPRFFQEFYPESEKIGKHEALEHHVHAYLQDFSILKNKLLNFLGQLKNDIKKVAINKDEIDQLITQFIENSEAVFRQVSDVRNAHHHRGRRLVMSSSVDAGMVEFLTADTNPLKASIRPEFIEELKVKAADSFEKEKNAFVELAGKNNDQITGLLNQVMKNNKSLLYQYLGIRPAKEMMKSLS
jgi:hypothetical protein